MLMLAPNPDRAELAKTLLWGIAPSLRVASCFVYSPHDSFIPPRHVFVCESVLVTAGTADMRVAFEESVYRVPVLQLNVLNPGRKHGWVLLMIY